MLTLLAFACRPPVVEPDAVGYRQVTLETLDGQPMPTAIWYPGVMAEAAQPASYVLGSADAAFADLEVATGPWPVVLFSHGNGGSRDAGALISERLAASGYIVASPDHTGNTFEDGFGSVETFVELFLRRPDDLARVKAHLEAEAADASSPFFERLDGTFAAGGHSTGGSTALLLAGGGIDKTTVLLACALDQITGTACEVAEATEGDIIYPELDDLPELSALVLYAPLSATLLDGAALVNITAPLFAAVGDRDAITPEDLNAGPVFDTVPTDAALARFADTGHYAFATLCGIEDLESLIPDAHQECTGPAFADPDTIVEATAELSAAWLSTHVQATPVALQPIADGYPEVTVVTRP